MTEAQEQVAEVVEAAGQAVEQQAEGVAEVVRSLNGLKIKYGLLGVAIGGAVGAIIGFKAAYQKAETKFDKIARDEIEEMRIHFYQKERAREEQQTKGDLAERVEELGYATREVPDIHVVPGTEGRVRVEDAGEKEEPAPVVQQNVFVENARGLSTDVWDYDKELANRTGEKPYVIHKQEFQEGNSPNGVDYEQTTVTYYVEDDVLADASDRRMDDVDSMVGLANLEKFGHGSEDANVVYIRNDRLQVDFEVLRSGGSYTAEVLGVTEDPPESELRHSDMRRRRPQFDDD